MHPPSPSRRSEPSAPELASAAGVTVTHAREPATERGLHAASALGVGVYVGRPVTFRWEGDGVRVRLRLGRGDVCVIPAGLPHAAAWDGPAEFLMISVGPHLIEAVAGEAGLSASAQPRPALGVRDPFLAEAAQALAHATGVDSLRAPRPESLPPRPVAGLFAAALGRAVVLHTLGVYGGPASDVQAAALRAEAPDRLRAAPVLLPRRVRRVTEYVRTSVSAAEAVADDDLSLARLAAEAGVSPSHLARAFRRATGESVHAFVARTRLDEAARLLRETRWPVARVALALGYASPSHFAQAFRRHTGRTPRAHRTSAHIFDGGAR